LSTVKLLSGTKCKIISTEQEGVHGGVEVWLLLLSYAPVKGQWLNARPARSVQFQTQTGPFS